MGEVNSYINKWEPVIGKCLSIKYNGEVIGLNDYMVRQEINEYIFSVLCLPNESIKSKELGNSRAVSLEDEIANILDVSETNNIDIENAEYPKLKIEVDFDEMEDSFNLQEVKEFFTEFSEISLNDLIKGTDSKIGIAYFKKFCNGKLKANIDAMLLFILFNLSIDQTGKLVSIFFRGLYLAIMLDPNYNQKTKIDIQKLIERQCKNISTLYLRLGVLMPKSGTSSLR